MRIEANKVSAPSEKSFGFLLSFCSLLLGIYFGVRHGKPLHMMAFVACSLITFVFSLKKPGVFELPNMLWSKLSEALAMISNPIVLGIVYFLLVTPIGLLRRLGGVDPLKLKSQGRETNWISKKSNVSYDSPFQNQY